MLQPRMTAFLFVHGREKGMVFVKLANRCELMSTPDRDVFEKVDGDLDYESCKAMCEEENARGHCDGFAFHPGAGTCHRFRAANAAITVLKGRESDKINIVNFCTKGDDPKDYNVKCNLVRDATLYECLEDGSAEEGSSAEGRQKTKEEEDAEASGFVWAASGVAVLVLVALGVVVARQRREARL